MRRITVGAVKRRAGRARAAWISLVYGFTPYGRRERPTGPAEFTRWLDRRGGRRTPGYPSEWRVRADLSLEQPCRVGVLMHVYYSELVPELLRQLGSMPVPFDLIVTNATGRPLRVDPGSAPRLRNVVVLEVDNRGRDIWPMAQVVNVGLLDPYEIVLKVHTKRSPWREAHADLGGSGEQWRTELLESLLGSEQNARSILSAFAENPALGVVTAGGSVFGPEFWGANATTTADLLRRLELSIDTSTLTFPGGSFYWIRGFLLQGLRALMLTADDFEREYGQRDGTTSHALERSIGILCVEAGLTVADTDTVRDHANSESWLRYEAARSEPNVRIVPFYLPQYHPTPENDRWWGKGFTEWTSVTAAQPVYEGHNQPNLPADLGFYDLRLDEVRQAQMELAAEHGVEGFMYYYYWFAGRRLLSTPIEKLLASDVDKPFCIMWANENWTRRWDGRDADVLMGQDYESVPAEQFIDDITPFLRDPRYMRIGGKPIVAVYRVGQFPNPTAVFEQWRARAHAAGIGDIHILAVDVPREFDGVARDVDSNGVDGTMGFPPHNLVWHNVPHFRMKVDRRFKGFLLEYATSVAVAERKLSSLDDSAFPGVMVNFDNTARRQWDPEVWMGSNPYTFRRWLAAASAAVADRDAEHRIVFVNAWNEWAESAVLEPSQRFGKTYLLAVRDVAYLA